jgi:hypothetical protein
VVNFYLRVNPFAQHAAYFSAAKRLCPGSGFPFQIHMWRECNVYGWIMEHSIISRGPTFRQRVSSRNAPFHQPETTFETRSHFFFLPTLAGGRGREKFIAQIALYTLGLCQQPLALPVALWLSAAEGENAFALSVPVCKPPIAARSHCLDKTKANCVCTRSWLRQPPIDWIDTC